nr:LamG domain-containing protein [Allomuricauda sp.]
MKKTLFISALYLFFSAFLSCTNEESTDTLRTLNATVVINNPPAVAIQEENIYTVYGKTHKSADPEKFRIAIQDDLAYFFDDKVTQDWVQLNPDKLSGLGGILDTYVTNGDYDFEDFLPQDNRNNYLTLKNRTTGLIRIVNFVVDNGEILKTPSNSNKEVPFKRVFFSNPTAEPYQFPSDMTKFENGFILGIPEIGEAHLGEVYLMKNMNQRTPKLIETGLLDGTLTGIERIVFNDLGGGNFIGVVAYHGIDGIYSSQIGLSTDNLFYGNDAQMVPVGNLNALTNMEFVAGQFVATGPAGEYCTAGNQDLFWNPCSGFQTGLVAYYPFNGNADDESGNDNHGAVNGATSTEDRHGNANSAYMFDGMDDEISVATTTILNNVTAGSHTVSLWLTKDAVSSSPKFVIDAADPGAAAGDQRGIRFESTEFPIFKWVTTDNSYRATSTEPIVQNDQWYHVVGVYDDTGKVGKIYINGAEYGTNTSTGTPSAISVLKIGNIAAGGTGDGHYQGKIDDIRIYNYAFGASDVDQLYQQEKPVFDPTDGLVAYYPFSGNADDASGNGNHGTVVNAVLTSDRFGNVDNAYSFDDVGNKRISLGTAINPAHMTNLTLSAWIKLDASFVTCCDGDSQTILGQGSGTGSSANYPFWFFFTYNGRYALKRNSPSLETDSFFYPEDGAWHHVAASAEGNTFKLYLDGVEVASRNDGGSPGGTNYQLAIGNLGNTSGTFGNTFNGDIDEVRIYDKALTATQIMDLYSN